MREARLLLLILLIRCIIGEQAWMLGSAGGILTTLLPLSLSLSAAAAAFKFRCLVLSIFGGDVMAKRVIF